MIMIFENIYFFGFLVFISFLIFSFFLYKKFGYKEDTSKLLATKNLLEQEKREIIRQTIPFAVNFKFYLKEINLRYPFLKKRFFFNLKSLGQIKAYLTLIFDKEYVFSSFIIDPVLEEEELEQLVVQESFMNKNLQEIDIYIDEKFGKQIMTQIIKKIESLAIKI